MCWIIWAYSLDWKSSNLWELAINLLRWNRNRWQDGYWISVLSDWDIQTFKFNDLNKDIQLAIEKISWKIVWIIWHARYPTSWWTDTSKEYVQPFEVKHLKLWIAFAFNWNIVNAEELAIEIEQSEWIQIKRPILDTNVLKYMILSKVKSWEGDLNKILEYINDKIDWACNIVLLSKDWGFAFSKDRWWFRPLSWEVTNWVLMFSSESSALFKVWWNNKPKFFSAWELVYVNWSWDKVKQRKLILNKPVRKASCFFESVYFADSKTFLWWTPSNLHRYRLWCELANNETGDFTIEDTVVIDIPSSSLYSAQWFSDTLDLKLLSGIITKNPESWRTFIEGSSTREEKIKQKYIFNPNLKRFIEWKKVILIDDSIVRWSTMEYLVQAFKEFYNPAEVHLRIPSSAVTSPCYYWINVPDIGELIVRKYFKDVNNPTESELLKLANSFWADSLRYLSIDWLINAIKVETSKLCLGCINSKYPTKCWQAEYDRQLNLS